MYHYRERDAWAEMTEKGIVRAFFELDGKDGDDSSTLLEQYIMEIKCFRRIRHNKRSLEIFVSASDQIDIGYELLSSHARVEN